VLTLDRIHCALGWPCTCMLTMRNIDHVVCAVCTIQTRPPLHGVHGQLRPRHQRLPGTFCGCCTRTLCALSVCILHTMNCRSFELCLSFSGINRLMCSIYLLYSCCGSCVLYLHSLFVCITASSSSPPPRRPGWTTSTPCSAAWSRASR
jgi:hypothetical protein